MIVNVFLASIIETMAMASNSEAPTTYHIDAAIAYSLREAECESLQLKHEQRRALRSILNGKDTIVVLPTGYGESLVHLLLPFATQYLRRFRGVSADPQRSMVVVVEPLSSLVEDQVKRATAMNLRPTNLLYHCALYNSEFKAVGLYREDSIARCPPLSSIQHVLQRLSITEGCALVCPHYSPFCHKVSLYQLHSVALYTHATAYCQLHITFT